MLILYHWGIVEALICIMGFPGSVSGKEPACKCRRHKKHESYPWVGKIPCSRAWQHAPVFLRVPWTARRSNQSILKEISLNIHRKDWCWSWNSNTLATWCEELIHWKRPWCWERLKAGGERDNRGWDGWMASLTLWIWVWVNSGSRWWTGEPGVLQSMGSQRIGHDWVTELNWTEPVFLPGESHGQRRLASYNAKDHKVLDVTEVT